jgi:hypothetical protein
VTLDGHPIGRAAWGTAMPVDPVQHVVAASRPGKKPWSVRVDIAPGAPERTIALLPLESAAPPIVSRPNRRECAGHDEW